MSTTCPVCNSWLGQNGCSLCGWKPSAESEGKTSEELKSENLAKIKSVKVFTTFSPSTLGKFEELGVVFGTSSKQAFWGLSTQADRLARAYEGALNNLKYEAVILGADAVIGVHFALNNSEGSGNKLVTGSSEAVMLLGTAVRVSQ